MSRKGLRRLLIVDDEQDVLFTLRTILETGSFMVDTNSSPIETLGNYDPGKYDLVILDVKMPEMNGFQLYKEILKMDPNVRVCFLTAGETYIEEFGKLFPELGSDRYLLKPIDAKHLLNRVEKIMTHK